MAIVQISKIQQRAGNLVDLPQLDNGEFGWATDENRLFIGRTGNTYTDENIEVLTSYSNISFSQINGSDGANFNIVSAQNGQILTYVGSTDTWENYTGLSSQLGGSKLSLGNVSNISITGGSIGYVLETDGQGNLSWTPKGSLSASIIGISNSNPMIMTVDANIPYTNNALVTISGVLGTGANTIVNGKSFYIQLAVDFSTSGNVGLYTTSGNSSPADGTGLTATANTGLAISSLGGGGSGTAAGANTTVQFNDSGTFGADASFTFDKSTKILTVSSGNVVAANISATSTVTSSVLISNIATGTSPLTVTSTTLVPNLFVARANVSEYANTALTSTGTWYPIFVNATSGNLAQGANANLSFNAATGALSATLLTGTLTTAAQPNITSVGTLTSLSVTGNITGGNLVGPHANGNSNVAIAQNANITFTTKSNSTMVISDTGANITGTANISGNANVGNLGTTTLIATTGNITTINSGLLQNGNSNVTITANANLTFTAKSNSTMVISDTGANITGTANISGNANVGNLGTTGQIISTIATGTAPFTVTSTTRVANLNVDQSNIANYANVITNITGTFYPTFVSGNTTANYQLASNANLSFNAATGALSATLFSGNGSSLSAIAGANVTGQVNYAATANAVAGANVSGQVTYAATANAVAGANVSGAVSYATTANSVAGANVTGTVANANVSIYEAVTTQSSGIYYPTFVNGNTTANYQLASNVSISANLANGALFATTFVGNVSGNISGNLIVNGSNTQVLFNDSGNANATSGFTFNKVTGVVAVTGNLTSGNANLGNAATANFFIGAGNNLSNIQGANVSGTVANATYAVSAGSATTAGTVTTAAQPNITSVGTLTSLAVTGNITNGNVTGGNLVSANYFTGTLTTAAQPNITSVGTLTGLTLANAAVISVGSNTNVGTFTGNFSLSAGSRLNATYADLAEYYEADKPYEPGTVVEFGGEKEVTIAEDGTTRVAGVVSTDPAYIMNSQCQGDHIVALALQGRVPVKVRGTIRKGDMLVSGGEGYARPMIHPYIGSVIGKALENFEGEGVIEVAVGRL